MMLLINKWRWNYITFSKKRVNIMVYETNGLETIVSVEKVDGH
jgi:hypothetical protein